MATERALYGPGGFYHRPEGPAGHFRTSVHASPLYARAVATLLTRVDAALGHPVELALLDLGAGRGELLTGVLRALEAAETHPPHGTGTAYGSGAAGEAYAPDGVRETGGAGGVRSPRGAGGGGVTRGLVGRLRPYAVERAKRPAGLDPRVAWHATLPAPGTLTGLLIANEWLDNVPVDVVEVDPDGVPRTVLVGPDGSEELGAPVTGADAAWLADWWPLGPEPGLRAEIGAPRDAAWARAARTLAGGLAVAVDYAHARASRPPYGTLTGFYAGREVPPVPDGSCDLTTHVALDACAAAGARELPGAHAPGWRTQRQALRALGVSGRRPPLTLASTDPTGYLRALGAAGEAAELTDPAGLGGFRWLCQPVGPLDVGDLLPNAPGDGPGAPERAERLGP
ncbi:SAM-dependent methyltransferase [Streptomyces sp. NPDC057702]|uniref:SAM-dependent methyltransferase n=1 Tax=unclassified Streptomyces TaxID=2593676 RepID=UPI00369106F6